MTSSRTLLSHIRFIFTTKNLCQSSSIDPSIVTPNMPAGTPARNYTNFDSPPSHDLITTIVHTIYLALVTVSWAIRLYTRRFMNYWIGLVTWVLLLRCCKRLHTFLCKSKHCCIRTIFLILLHQIMTLVYTGPLFRGAFSLSICKSVVLKQVSAQRISFGRHMWEIRAMSLENGLKVICPST